MFKYRIPALMLIFITALACSTKKISTLKTDAETAYGEEKYEEAYLSYTEYIALKTKEGTPVSDTLLLRMAVASDRTGRDDEALKYYRILTDKGSRFPEVYENLAVIYRNENRVKEEAEALEKLKSLGPESSDKINKRLFELYSQNGKYDSVVKLWPQLPSEFKESVESLKIYHKALKETKDESGKLGEISMKILKTDPDYEPALAWKGDSLYNKAEAEYKKEMDWYEALENKTQAQYLYLKRDLKKIGKVYVQARDIFEKLHKESPENPLYLKYLLNIALRLDNADEAKHYNTLLEKMK